MPISLAEIVENKKLEIKQLEIARRSNGGKSLNTANMKEGENSFIREFTNNQLNLICEIKPRSPSMGELGDVKNWQQIVEIYSRHAAAISVLTDEKYFGGSLKLLKDIDDKCSLPLLRKDFIIAESQCYEALEHGADAVLLIVKILDDENLANLHSVIQRLGMAAVVEIQNDEELERALRLLPKVLLINNRDLSTFEIDLDTTRRLAPKIPENIIKISASGIQSKADIEGLIPHCTNFLIGSALMQSNNMDQLLKELLSSRRLISDDAEGKKR